MAKDRYEIRLGVVLSGETGALERACEEIADYAEREIISAFGANADGGYEGPRAEYVRAKPLTHSGYRNFETFCVANFVSGNYTGEATYHAARAWAAMPGDDRDLARRLRLWVENDCRDGLRDESGSLVSDLLSGALEEVDWDGIARHVRAE